MGYLNDYANNVSAITMQGADAQARAQQQVGNIYGGLMSTLGQIAAGVPREIQQKKLDDLKLASGQLTYDEQKKQHDDEIKADQILKDSVVKQPVAVPVLGADGMPIGLQPTGATAPTGEIDYKSAIRKMQTSGLVKQAGVLQGQMIANQKAGVESFQKTLETNKAAIANMSNAIRGVTDQASLDKVRPMLLQSLPKEMQGIIPTQYSEDAISKLADMGMSAQESLDYKNKASTYALQALELKSKQNKTAEDDRIAKEKTLAGWANWVSSVKNDADYQEAKNYFTKQGLADADTVSVFGKNWSPEVQQKAADYAVGAEKRAQFEATRESRITTQGNENARATMAVQQRADEWKDEVMRQLNMDRSRVVSSKETNYLPVKVISDEEYARQKAQIQETYQRMLQRTPANPTPGAGGAQTPPPPPPPPPPPQQTASPEERKAAQDNLSKKGLPSSDADVTRFLSSPSNLAGIRTQLSGRK